MRKELGKCFLDIAKYMITAVLLTSLFSGVNEWAWYMYGLVVLAVLVTLLTGLKIRRRINNGSNYCIGDGDCYCAHQFGVF